MGYWAELSKKQLNDIFESCKQSGCCVKETVKKLNEGYPFGEKQHHPYRVWVREHRAFFAKHNLPLNGREKTQKESDEDFFLLLKETFKLPKFVIKPVTVAQP